MNIVNPVVFGAALLCAGCASTDHAYRPTTHGVPGAAAPSADYAIPGDHPQGDVQLFGGSVTEVQFRQGGRRIPVFQVQMIVANSRAAAQWAIDATAIKLVVPGAGEYRPLMVNADAGTPPLVLVDPGETRVINLFYPAPAGVNSDQQLPVFTVVWQVTAGAGTITRRTTFERSPLDRGRAARSFAFHDEDPGREMGFGPRWWYAPWYPWPSYGYGGREFVERPYRFYYRAFPGRRFAYDSFGEPFQHRAGEGGRRH